MAEQLLLAPFANTDLGKLPFTRIHAHDGSTLKLHEGLKDTFAGRFTRTMPAAVELHLTLDLLNGNVDYMGINADKESERLYQPYANESAGILQLMDAGYFDKGNQEHIDPLLCELSPGFRVSDQTCFSIHF